MITIDELFTPPTSDEIFDSMIASLITIGLPADKWRSGGVARSILRVVAVLYAGFAVMISTIAKAGFLFDGDGAPAATGGWLTILARYVYGVLRIEERFATGAVDVTNAAGGLFVYAAGDFVVKKTASGKTYRNLNPFTLNPVSVVLGVEIEAFEIGTASNAAPAEVDALETPQTGVSVTNPAAVVGQDAESDASLAQRCLDSLGGLSPFGPRAAYSFAITSTKMPDGSSPNINRFTISPYSSTGRVLVYVASPAGPVTSPELDAVEASIEDLARADTDTLELHSATAVPFLKTITVYAKKTKGLDATMIQDQVDAILIDGVAAWPIGGRTRPGNPQGYLFDASIEEIAKAANPAIYLVEGDGIDLPLSINEVATLATTIIVRIVETA